MRKKWKWILTGLAAVFIVLAGANWLYHAVSKQEWEAQRSAVRMAYEKTLLTKTHKVERFTGDSNYIVITGEDKLGEPLYVWVGEEGIRSEMAANGISSADAEAKVGVKQPGAQVLRTTPGLINGNPVWEVFYKLAPENNELEQYYYSYYAFKDGAPLDTWSLSIK